eukprot:scaffold1447_cov115-Isochrysis_galbana.AAC.2
MATERTRSIPPAGWADARGQLQGARGGGRRGTRRDTEYGDDSQACLCLEGARASEIVVSFS